MLSRAGRIHQRDHSVPGDLRIQKLIAALVAAMVVWSGPIGAQAIERSDTPRRGALRVTFDPRVMAWERVYTPAGRQPLGAAFAGDSLPEWRPSVVRLQQDMRAVTGLAGYVASVGRELLAVRAERRVMPIGFEYGITRRLSVGFTIPIVRVMVREGFRVSPPGANLGTLPRAAADSVRYSAFFGNLDAALAQLGDSIAGGAYGCPGSAACLRAQAVLAQGQTLRFVLGRAVYGTPDTAALFLPVATSDAGRSLTAVLSALERALVDTFNVTAFAQDTFLLPAVPLSGVAAADSLAARLSRLGLSPYVVTPKRLRFFSGDVEVAARYAFFGRQNYAATATLLIRLPTGHQDSPNDPFDIATGDHQTDIEARLTQELTLWNRVWLNLSLRAARQLPGERERRVGPVDQLFLPANTLARLRWDPGDYAIVDFAPMFRFSRAFAAGITAGYFTQGRDRYTFRTAQDSLALATQLGAPVAAGVLDAGTAQRHARLGVAVTYAGPRIEGGLSMEQTVSGAGGPVPAATVFRVVLRQTILLF